MPDTYPLFAGFMRFEIAADGAVDCTCSLGGNTWEHRMPMSTFLAYWRGIGESVATWEDTREPVAITLPFKGRTHAATALPARKSGSG